MLILEDSLHRHQVGLQVCTPVDMHSWMERENTAVRSHTQNSEAPVRSFAQHADVFSLSVKTGESSPRFCVTADPSQRS